jgi:hypothetical protein
MGRAKVQLRRSKAKSLGKKSLKKVRLPGAKADESSDKKSYKKLPGFDAFNVKTPFKHSLSHLNILIALRLKLRQEERRKAACWWNAEKRLHPKLVFM